TQTSKLPRDSTDSEYQLDLADNSTWEYILREDTPPIPISSEEQSVTEEFLRDEPLPSPAKKTLSIPPPPPLNVTKKSKEDKRPAELDLKPVERQNSDQLRRSTHMGAPGAKRASGVSDYGAFLEDDDVEPPSPPMKSPRRPS